MIVYKIDEQPNSTTNAQLYDMLGVLKEVSTTYEILLATLDAQTATLSSPSINNFRAELRSRVNNSIKTSRTIADHTEKLALISEQATKHLKAIEERFNAALEKHITTAD